jgi:hypothetical protein
MRILPLPDPRHRPRPAAHPTRAPQQTRFVFPKTEPAAKTPAAPPLWPSTQYAQLPCPHPSGIRADRPPPGRHRHLAAKSVLKIQHQPTPPLHGSRPHTAGRTTTCLPERNQEAPATCSIRTRAPARPAAGAPGSRPAPAPAQQLQPGGSRSRHGRPAARAPGTALRLCRLAWLPPTGPKANGP